MLSCVKKTTKTSLEPVAPANWSSFKKENHIVHACFDAPPTLPWGRAPTAPKGGGGGGARPGGPARTRRRGREGKEEPTTK